MHWRRVGTLFSSSGDNTGTDPRAALWAPMPVYNSTEQRWNLFYVAYRSKPNVPPAWYLNYDGELVRAVSQVKGREGIDGPYRDAGIVMRPGPGSDNWEGSGRALVHLLRLLGHGKSAALLAGGIGVRTGTCRSVGALQLS
jgi:hypothetical protein